MRPFCSGQRILQYLPRVEWQVLFKTPGNSQFTVSCLFLSLSLSVCLSVCLCYWSRRPSDMDLSWIKPLLDIFLRSSNCEPPARSWAGLWCFGRRSVCHRHHHLMFWSHLHHHHHQVKTFTSSARLRPTQRFTKFSGDTMWDQAVSWQWWWCSLYVSIII